MDSFAFPMDCVLVQKDGKLIKEEYYLPYHAGKMHRMFSIAKSYTSLAIGALICEEKLRMEDHIADYFPECVSSQIQDDSYAGLRNMTIRDMLMMRTCFAQTTYKKNPKENWVESFFRTMPDHKPGMIFQYDTSAALVLAALVNRLSGKNVLDYLRDVFLNEIGFSKDAYFMKDPFGADDGGSGMMAYPTDLLVTGKFLLAAYRQNLKECYPHVVTGRDGSTYNEAFFHKYEDYIKEALSFHTSTVHNGKTRSEKEGYGYMFWMMPEGGRMMYGMGGQYLLIYPKQNLIAVVTADAQSEGGGTQQILDWVERTFLRDGGTSFRFVEKDLQSDALQPADSDNASIASLFGEYETEDTFAFITGFTLDEKEIRLRTAKGDYRFPYSVGGYSNPETVRDGLCCCGKAIMQPDGSLYLCVRLAGESVGMLHIMICKKDQDFLLYLRKVAEYVLPEFNGFFDARFIS